MRPIRLYDVHAHLADQRLIRDLPVLLQTSYDHGVRGILVNAARAEEWSRVVALSESPIVSGAVGIHPFFVQDWRGDLQSRLRSLLNSDSGVVAVGEIGLDFYHGRDSEREQTVVFEAQLSVAVEEGVPAVFHNRRSWSDFFAILKSSGRDLKAGVCHHFTGSREVARQALDRNLYLSFCGPLTYPNAHRIKAAAQYAPLDRVLTETDCPDLPVEAFRQGRSEPFHVRYIVEEIARLKGKPAHVIAEAVEENYQRLLA